LWRISDLGSAILLAGIVIIDFICSLFAFSLGSISKFKLEEYIETLKKTDSDNGSRYDLKKEKALALFEHAHTMHLTVLFSAYIMDLCFIMVMLFSYIYTDSRTSVSPLITAAVIFGGYVIGIYVICRVFAFNMAEGYAESIVFNNYRTLKVLSVILAPIDYILNYTDTLLKKVARVGRSEQGHEEEVEDEIKESITEGVEDGVLEEDEKKMIESVLKFDDADVKEVMTPRTDIVSIKMSSTVSEAIELAMKSGFSRIPAYEKNVDDIKGVVYVKDLLGYAGRKEPDAVNLKDIVREAYFIPESKMISELFKEIREKKNHFAVVLDEYGGTSGIVTAEDIIEEIVGEIEDEYDAQPNDKVTWISDTEAEVDARIDIGELNEIMDISLPDEDDFESLGGFLASETGKIPEVNETVTYDNILFRIMRGTKRRILWVKVKKQEG